MKSVQRRTDTRSVLARDPRVVAILTDPVAYFASARSRALIDAGVNVAAELAATARWQSGRRRR